MVFKHFQMTRKALTSFQMARNGLKKQPWQGALAGNLCGSFWNPPKLGGPHKSLDPLQNKHFYERKLPFFRAQLKSVDMPWVKLRKLQLARKGLKSFQTSDKLANAPRKIIILPMGGSPRKGFATKVRNCDPLLKPPRGIVILPMGGLHERICY